MNDGAFERYRAACAQAVERAKAKLTLAEVWDLGEFSGQEPCPARGLGVVKSPLRADGKPSFSVFAGGKAFDDKAREGAKGGVWEFVEQARPGMTAAEIARLLAERAGERWPDKRDFFARTEGAAPVDDALKARLLKEQRLAKARQEREQRDRAERARREERAGPRAAAAVRPWPECVAARWAEGARFRDHNQGVLARLCERRAWPVAWSDVLVGIDAMAFPVEAWCEPGAAGERRMVAFRVEAPVRGAKGALELRPVGYHQKFYNVARGESGWRFFPSLIREQGERKAAARCSSYEAAVLAAADERGVTGEESMVPPLPYVVGDLAAPKLVIILEGQWDALTMLGALGGLNPDDEGLRGVAIFGVRGAKGTGTLLAHWGAWLKKCAPQVWLLPDNDEAKTGARWYPPGRAAERAAGRTYFSEQLAWAGASRVVVTPLAPEMGGKDFNDYFKTMKPRGDDMRRWMEQLKLTA